MPTPILPDHLPTEQRERIAVLTIIHEGKAFSPSEVYRLRDPEPDPALAHLPTLLEGLWAALAPGHSESSRYVLARVSRARRPFLAAWWDEDFMGVEINPEDGLGFAIEWPDRATRHGTPLWHSLAAVDAQAKAEAQGQTWLNAPGVVERVLSEMQAATWAAWNARWRGQISEAEAHYRQSVEVRWAAAIFAGQHPGYAILPVWHLEQLSAYLRQVYYYQDQCCALEDVPPLDEVVEGVMWACSDTANLRLQSLYFPEGAMSDAWLNHLVAEMAEDVVMHAAYLRGLVEDEGLSDE
jgi:hypothetical protein